VLSIGLEPAGLRIERASPASPVRRVLVRAANSRVAARVGVLIMFALAWELAARAIGGLLIPGFLEAIEGMVALVSDGSAASALYESNKSLVVGYGLAVVIGVPFGLLIGQHELLERASNPYLNVLLVTPMAALIPSFIIAFGVGLASRALLVCLFAVVMVVVNSRAGVRQVDPSLVEMARVYGASTVVIWRKVLLPGALPAVMAGLRIGLGRAISGVVIVELLMAPAGIGAVILDARDSFDAASLYGMVLIVLIESVVLIEGLRLVERRFTNWR
jgi:ABC-type nitrate/sulfonate/bicarbonate transport system, permease component